jgi:hypothetical protein
LESILNDVTSSLRATGSDRNKKQQVKAPPAIHQSVDEEFRMHGPVLFASILMVWGLALPGMARAEQFIVAELPGHESHLDAFVVTLTDPANIAHARDLITRGPAAGATIVGAEIAAGLDEINRNYRAAGAPPWSWHVVGEARFADFGIELYDGWPGLVESDVQGWLRNTGGHIGFWGYTVVAEISPPGVPEPASVVLLVTGMAGLVGWAHVGRSRHQA